MNAWAQSYMAEISAKCMPFAQGMRTLYTEGELCICVLCSVQCSKV